MRLAVAGKGGAGKTTLSATLARLAARQGHPVVAVDADANPNLHAALGLTTPPRLQPLPPQLVSRRPGGAGLTTPINQVLEQYAMTAPDGVQLIGMGGPAHAEEGCLCSAHAVVASLLEDLGAPERFVVVDMEASPEHLSRGTVRHVDAVWLIAEPYYRSLETIRRLAGLVAELPVPVVAVVGNKIRNVEDAAALQEFCVRHGLTYAGGVPWSDEVLAADRERTSIIDRPAASAVVQAIEKLAATL